MSIYSTYYYNREENYKKQTAIIILISHRLNNVLATLLQIVYAPLFGRIIPLIFPIRPDIPASDSALLNLNRGHLVLAQSKISRRSQVQSGHRRLRVQRVERGDSLERVGSGFRHFGEAPRFGRHLATK